MFSLVSAYGQKIIEGFRSRSASAAAGSRIPGPALTVLLAIIGCLQLQTPEATAANRDWSGAMAGIGLWTSTNSWFNGVVPANNTSADTARFARFANGPQFQPNVNQARSVRGVQILPPDDGSTPLPFTFTGSALTIGPDGIQVFAGSSNGHTFENNLVVSASNQIWTVETTLIINGNMSGAGGLAKAGSDALQLNGIGTWTGGTTIRRGTIQVSGGNALPDTGSLTFFQDGNVPRKLNLDENETIGGLSSPVGVTQVSVELDSSALTVSGGGDFAAGLITGDATSRLIKMGSDLLTIRTANTYLGGTTISDGELTVASTTGKPLGPGNQLVNNTGRLSGSGNLGATVSVQGSGTLAGNFNMSGLQMSGGRVELDWMQERLVIAGPANIATGTLEIVSDTPLNPVVGTVWNFLSATGGVSGQFANTILPTLPSDKTWRVFYTTSSVQLGVVANRLPGDYNNDGTVNAADYTVWRNSVGQTGQNLPADGTGLFGVPDGVVNRLDYNFWKAHYGDSNGSGSVSAGNLLEQGSVPEPVSAFLSVAAVLGLIVGRRRRKGMPSAVPSYNRN